MSPCTDAELVTAARNGDVDSFGELYRRHYSAAVGVAYSAFSDRHAAEDIAQEAFVIACRTLPALRDAGRFSSWICGICRKMASRQRLRRHQHLSTECFSLAADVAEVDEESRIIREAVARLPRAAREVIVLHYFSGLSHQQIADTLEISPQAVHGRLIRARKRIAIKLQALGVKGTVQ